ncbi:MAG: hypothetical protein ACRD96_00625 [Bryobacteraceae bacterium]
MDRAKKRVVWLAGAAAALAAGMFAAVWFYRGADASTAALAARLPSDGAPVLAVDAAALRRAGILDLLGGAGVDPEPEYKTFVAKTGFDYGRDLDAALVSFHSTGVYFLLRGRFDWPRLEAYAAEQGGVCVNSVCRMQGSQPDRRISYYSLRRDVMALAVSRDEFAATRLSERRASTLPSRLPAQPVWLLVPSAALQDTGRLPAGTQLFAKALQDSVSVTLGLGATGQAFEASLEVVCRNEREAAVLSTTLGKITKVLVEMIAREKQTASPRDLSGVLTAGVFRQEGARVLGRWPIQRVFFEELAGAR